jgi:type IV pilus assembly protein PilB
VTCVVGQRLARALCDACKEPRTISAEMLRENGFEADTDISAFGPVGCVRCGSTGFRGRMGLFEVMPVTRAIRELILALESAEAIADLAIAEGMSRIADHGLDHVREGRTSIEEVLRVTAAA